MTNDYEPREQTGVAGMVRVLRRHLAAVLIPLVLVPSIAGAYALSQEEEYTATASLLFRSTPGSDFRLSSSDDEEREAATNVSLASLAQVADRTSRALGPDVTPGAVSGAVDVSADGAANLLAIQATTTDPRLSSRIAEEYARQFVAFRRQADRGSVADARRLLNDGIARVESQLVEARQGAGTPGAATRIRTLRAERAQLLDEAQELSALGTLASGNVELAQRPDREGSLSSPPASRTVVLGLALGLLLGIGAAFLFDLLDRRLRDPQEVEAVFRRPTLGVIPLSPALARNDRMRRRRAIRGGLGAGEMEAFHMLRANLRYFEVERPIESVVVTSAAPAEGKSTVAWNLAAAGANAGARTLLIEAELRRPTFVREFKLENTRGLSEILAGDASPWDVVQRFAAGASTNGDGHGPAMDVIVAGKIPPNPTDLLESTRMRELISSAEEAYDMVVIDTPPVAVVSDAIPLLKWASGVIVVTLLGSTRRDAAVHLRRQLDGLGANVLGVVVNGMRSDDGVYGSIYGYAEDYEPSPPVATAR